jgi:hypothetical protein
MAQASTLFTTPTPQHLIIMVEVSWNTHDLHKHQHG